MISLLFAQWAMASYVCPRAAPVAGAAVMATMPDCIGMTPAVMDPEQPQLCKAHCEQGPQSVNASPSPAPLTMFNLVAVLDWHASAALPLLGRAPIGPDDTSSLPPPGSPPIYLVLRVLRD